MQALTVLCCALCGIFGYLIGSVSISVLLSGLIFHNDIRKRGSGNAGAANAARVYGLGVGIATFAGDFAKGVLAVWLARLIGGAMIGAEVRELCTLIGGAACLLGHCFPLYFHFRGGKAVSTGAAMALMIDRRIFLIIIAVFIIAAFISHIASVSSMSASIALVVCAILFNVPMYYLWLSLFTCLLVIFMHRGNIRRLLHGQEPHFSFGSRKKSE